MSLLFQLIIMRKQLLLILSVFLLNSSFGQDVFQEDTDRRYQIGMLGGLGIAAPRFKYITPVFEGGINLIISSHKKANQRLELLLLYNKDQVYDEKYEVEHSDVFNFGVMFHPEIYYGQNYRFTIAFGGVLGLKLEHQYDYLVVGQGDIWVVYDTSKKGERTTLFLPILGPMLGIKQEFRIVNELFFHVNISAMSQLDVLGGKLLSPELKTTVTAGVGISYAL